MPAGTEVKNNDYGYLITDSGRSFGFKKAAKQSVSAPSWINKDSSIATETLVAAQPTTWVYMSATSIKVPVGASSGTIRYFCFDADGGDEVDVYPGAGIEIYDANGKLQFSGSWGFMKILAMQQFGDTYTGYWSYTAPSGRQIAAVVSGGYGDEMENTSSNYGDWYDRVFRITGGNRFETQYMEMESWDYPDNNYHDEFKEALTIIIVDVTDLMRFAP